MKQLKIVALLTALCLSLPLGASAKERQGARMDWREQHAYTPGVQADIFPAPLSHLSELRFAWVTQVPSSASTPYSPLNHFRHLRKLEDANDRDGGSPNADTSNSADSLEVSREPVNLTQPDRGGRSLTFETAPEGAVQVSAQQPVGNQGDSQSASDVKLPFLAIETGSPRQTISTFISVRDQLEEALAAYEEDRSQGNSERIIFLLRQFVPLIDLSSVPAANRAHAGFEALGNVLDIIGRVGLPDLIEIPEAVDEAGNEVLYYNIPRTPLRIVRIDEGPREREYLFDDRTVFVASRYAQQVDGLPLLSNPWIKNWTERFRQITGPMVPKALVSNIPGPLLETFLDTPIWKVLLQTVVVCLMLFALFPFYRLIRYVTPRNEVLRPVALTLLPGLIFIYLLLFSLVVSPQLNTSGRYKAYLEILGTLVAYAALSWVFWLFVRFIAEAIIARSSTSSESLDANLVRLVGRLVGVVGVVIIFAIGANNIGLPVMSLLAGLGIGGLAIALAIRPTLENLIGGFVLYIDRPIRIGDFCTFGDQSGTVESIGVRSTQIRALDRTLISIPNAQFADMKLINWARCDQMLLKHTIGLRYETSAEQLRYVLAKLREMFLSHPRIDQETVRVRFSGYGESCLNVSIRVYAKTSEWNDYYAIQEDVLLRMKDIVESSGTGFAFPTQTLHLGRDHGLDSAMSATAVETVEQWRRAGRLPFPTYSESEKNAMAETLDYPPQGSSGSGGTSNRISTRQEPLAEGERDEGDGDKASSKPSPTRT